MNIQSAEKNKHRLKNKKSILPKQTLKPFPVVGIGASAGGLEALKSFFKAMPPDVGIAFVLIQHLDPTHESMMADLIGKHTQMPATQISDGIQVAPNSIFLIPPNHDLIIEGEKLILLTPDAPRGLRMPINRFFRSLAENRREKAICIIMSGTGSDGTLGLRAVKEHGGLVMAQEPSTAQYDGMPCSAIDTGLVDFILPVANMPGALTNFIRHAYSSQSSNQPLKEDAPDADLLRVLKIIQARVGHDFTHYKLNTLNRRTKRRMMINQIKTLNDYISYLQRNETEVDALYKDFLINVTSFFREPQCWDVLSKQEIPKLLKRCKKNNTLRVWVPGCSTGEEAYSIAMLLCEASDNLPQWVKVQIFATDIDKKALENARLGCYPVSVTADINAQLLKKYFQKKDRLYKANPLLRDKLVFSAHDLIRDPPFSKIDWISCRNLLIYLNSDIKNRIIRLFHFALNPNGLLTLGSSESIGHNEELFKTVSKKWRIFMRTEVLDQNLTRYPIESRKKSNYPLVGATAGDEPSSGAEVEKVVIRALLESFAPASVMINIQDQILYHFGDTVNYLHYPTGLPTNNLFAALREGIKTIVRAAVGESRRSGNPVCISSARVKRNGHLVPVEIFVRPIKENEENPQVMHLVSFKEKEEVLGIDHAPNNLDKSHGDLIKHLQVELKTTKNELHNIFEAMESSNEKLKSSNEEVMSMNEELQSANEELETSKEELQSLNQELHTVNSELEEKVEELSSRNNDLNNLINNTKIATVFLDNQLKIKLYTPTISSLFSIKHADIGRPISDLTSRFIDSGLQNEIEKVMDTLVTVEKEIKTDDDRWFMCRILPYRVEDDNVDGIVVLFDEITQLKESQERFRAIFEQTLEATVLVDIKCAEIVEFNRKASEYLDYPDEELINRSVFSLIADRQKKKYERHIRKVIEKGLDLFEIDLKNKGGDRLKTQISSRLVMIKSKQYAQSIWWRFD